MGKSFGERVLERIDALKISRAEAARRAAVSPDLIRDFARRPGSTTSLENAVLLSKALGITLTDDGPEPATTEPDDAATRQPTKPKQTGNPLRELRLHAGLTIEEAAARLLMDRDAYAEAEDAKRFPAAPLHLLDMMERIAQGGTTTPPAPLHSMETIIRDRSVEIRANVTLQEIDTLIRRLELAKAMISDELESKLPRPDPR